MKNCLTIKSLIYLLSLVLFFSFFTGCVSTKLKEVNTTQARDFDETKIDNIEIGKTTKSEIISTFGESQNTYAAANGAVMGKGEAERYVYTGKNNNGEINVFEVGFDSNGVVIHSKYYEIDK